MNIYILTFIVTALFDVLLRYISLNQLLDYQAAYIAISRLARWFCWGYSPIFNSSCDDTAANPGVHGCDFCHICFIWIPYEGNWLVSSP